jgi:hypothetical protein
MFGVAHRAMESVSCSERGPQMDTVTLPGILCSIHHRLGTVPIGEPSIGT